jgi:prefoldin subunit 5
MVKNLKTVISFIFIIIAISIAIWCFMLKKSYQVERIGLEDSLFSERVIVERAQERLMRTRNEIDGLNKSIDNLMQKAALLESEVLTHRQDLVSTKNKLNQFAKHNLSVKHQIEQASADINNIQNRIEYFTKETVKVDERLTLLLKTKDALTQQLEQYVKAPPQPVMAARREQDIYQDSYRPMHDEELHKTGLLSGEVLTVNREFAFLVVNLGKTSGIKEGMVLTVLRDNKNLAKVKVETVREYISVASFLDNENMLLIKTGDSVLLMHGA